MREFREMLTQFGATITTALVILLGSVKLLRHIQAILTEELRKQLQDAQKEIERLRREKELLSIENAALKALEGRRMTDRKEA